MLHSQGDDSVRELLDWNKREGLIFQQGGGAGVNLSAIRSSREPVSRGGLASGPVSFMLNLLAFLHGREFDIEGLTARSSCW